MATVTQNSNCETTTPGTGRGGGETTGPKRPARDSINDRASKRRAVRACLSCRNRKVRCDMIIGGHPCTNCRLDEIDCVIKESNRGRKLGVPSSTRHAPPESPPQNESFSCSPPQVQPASPLRTPTPSAERPSRPSDYLVSLSFEDHRGSFPSPEVGDEVHVNVHPENHHDDCSKPPPRVGSLSAQSPAAPVHLHSQPEPNDSIPHLPPYIRPLPPHISSQDLKYLADKGALTIPDDGFRDELLRAYVTIVYPLMPAIDLEDFLGPVLRGDSRNPVSLLLFQGVMFASVAFVDLKTLQMCGYASRKAARKAFFGRVRLLYGLDCEQDRLSLLQAVLLMTFWHDCPDDDKDTWYWMGIALSLAHVLGIHREPELFKTSTKKKQLRRRIWWSCVMRDRLLGLGIRRPSRIREEEFDVPSLTLDDFELNPPPELLGSLLGESRLASRNPSARTELAVICIELSKLCVCLGHILHSQYTLLRNQPIVSEHQIKLTVVSKQSRTKLQDQLGQWLNCQDPCSRYKPDSGEQEFGDTNDRATDIIRLHQAQLHLAYLTTVAILHKPEVLYSESNITDDGERQKISRKKITEAAVAMTKLAYDLQSRNQIRYLSTNSVPYFLSACLIHLLDIRSPREEVRNASIGRFYQCMHVIRQLQDIYSSADYSIDFLDAVLRSTDITVPMMRPGMSLSRTDGTRPHMWRFQKSTQESGTSGDITTAYPSPSSTQNQHVRAELIGINNDNSFQTSIIQPPAPLNAQFDTWSLVNTQFGGVQDSGECLPDPLFMGNLIDLDILLPTLINIDSDSSFSLSNNIPFM